jgi:preprotein translocase subunit SecD
MKTAKLSILIIVGLALQSYGQDILEFRRVHADNAVLRRQAQTGHVAAVLGYSVVTQQVNGATNLYWVNRRRELSADAVSSIAVQTNSQTTVSLLLRFTPRGARQVAVMTTDPWHTNQQSIAIFAGERFLTVLPITEPITGGEIRIEGVVSAEEAQKLKASLERRQAEPGVGR